MPPTTTQKQGTTVGIEIEFFIPNLDSSRNRIQKKLNEASLFCTRAHDLSMNSDRNTVCFGLKNDTSIKGLKPDEIFDEGLELITTPFFLTEENIFLLTKAIKTLKDSGARVNKTCGLHVHVGVANKNMTQIKTVFERFNRFSKEFEFFVDENRIKNKYCSHLTEDEQNTIRSAVTFEDFKRNDLLRYHSINPQSVITHATIEFRQFHGTLDEEEIVAWIKTVVAFFETSCGMAPIYNPLFKTNTERYRSFREEFLKNAAEKNKIRKSLFQEINAIKSLIEKNIEINEKLFNRNYKNSLEFIRKDEEKLRLAKGNQVFCPSLNLQIVEGINNIAEHLFGINELIHVVDHGKQRFSLEKECPISLEDMFKIMLNKPILNYLMKTIENGKRNLGKKENIEFNIAYPAEDNFAKGLDPELLKLLASKQMKKRLKNWTESSITLKELIT